MSKPYYTIGRADVDIVMNNQSVSRYHCLLQFKDNGDLFVYDLNSSHGTFLNRVRLKPLTYCHVRNGDVISLGESTR